MAKKKNNKKKRKNNNKKRGKNNKSPQTTFGRLNNLEILCWDANTKVAQTPCLLVGLQLSMNHSIYPQTYIR